MEGRFTDNAREKRFEYHVDGGVATATYRREGGTLYIDFVHAPEALRGTGAAGRLMRHILDAARAENLSITPVCGYAAAWLKKHGSGQDTSNAART